MENDDQQHPHHHRRTLEVGQPTNVNFMRSKDISFSEAAGHT
jgi:hypothetical protein